MALKLIKHIEPNFYFITNKDGSTFATTDDWHFKNTKGCHKLSLKNCEAIENNYDLDELVEECVDEYADRFDYNDGQGNRKVYSNSDVIEKVYSIAFQKALSILGDKKFSEENMEDAYYFGSKKLRKEYLDFIKTFQQTEWDVEIVVDDTCCYGTCSEADYNVCADGCVNKKESEKNDAKRFLMLKRK